MTKVQGFARRRDGMSHEDCVRHHKDVHSRLGLAQAEHMSKYVLYYFEEAFGPDGSRLADMPYDMSALEWYSNDERWVNFQDWLESEPDGQEVKEDESSFLERDRCYLCPYEERIVVDEAIDDAFVVFRILTIADGVSPDDLIAHHRSRCAPAVRAAFGGALRSYVVNFITEATSLATGRIEYKPFDLIEIVKIGKTDATSLRNVIDVFVSESVTTAEDPVIARHKTLTFSCEEVAFIA